MPQPKSGVFFSHTSILLKLLARRQPRRISPAERQSGGVFRPYVVLALVVDRIDEILAAPRPGAGSGSAVVIQNVAHV